MDWNLLHLKTLLLKLFWMHWVVALMINTLKDILDFDTMVVLKILIQSKD